MKVINIIQTFIYKRNKHKLYSMKKLKRTQKKQTKYKLKPNKYNNFHVSKFSSSSSLSSPIIHHISPPFKKIMLFYHLNEDTFCKNCTLQDFQVHELPFCHLIGLQLWYVSIKILYCSYVPPTLHL